MKTLENKNLMEEIIAVGTRAPSGHNTQPWRFTYEHNEIRIHPDFTRSLPVVDSDNHALYISLGCAAENVVIAAGAKGRRATVTVMEDPAETAYIKISLKPGSPPHEEVLAEHINARQSTRNKYSGAVIPREDLEKLQGSFSFEGIKVQLFTKREEIDQLLPFIIEASNLQFQNKDFVKELISWIRFDKKEARQGDGIWAASMGFPQVGRSIGSLVLSRFVSTKSEAKRWKQLVESSPCVALFIANKNDIPHWVSLGRAFQRFALTATQLNINHAHMNMPCEEVNVRKKMEKHLGLHEGNALLLLRLGYSEKMPFSYRRDLKEVIGTRETAV